mmetsp:Transcript_21743/g.59574  ORF Transcript_21743/g.59574 Transcript_21743/m.59574 type:complete len:189 (+) Transcript_21743:582-1148(+)
MEILSCDELDMDRTFSFGSNYPAGYSAKPVARSFKALKEVPSPIKCAAKRVKFSPSVDEIVCSEEGTIATLFSDFSISPSNSVHRSQSNLVQDSPKVVSDEKPVQPPEAFDTKWVPIQVKSTRKEYVLAEMDKDEHFQKHIRMNDGTMQLAWVPHTVTRTVPVLMEKDYYETAYIPIQVVKSAKPAKH